MVPCAKVHATSLTRSLEQDKTRLGRILEPFFHKYDRNGDGRIDLTEMHALLAGVHTRDDASTQHMHMTHGIHEHMNMNMNMNMNMTCT